MIPAACKTCKKTPRSFKSTNLLLFYDQNHCLCKMAAILKKGAILDFQMASKLQEIIPVAFKTH